MRAVITGATSGIGKAMACQLAQDGWSLVLTGRNQTVLEQLQKNLPTAVEILPLDLAEEEAPYQLFDFCKKKRVDLLVNNAGFGIFGRFTETNLQEEMDLLAVNVRALHSHTLLYDLIYNPDETLFKEVSGSETRSDFECCFECWIFNRAIAVLLLCLEKLCCAVVFGDCRGTPPAA